MEKNGEKWRNARKKVGKNDKKGRKIVENGWKMEENEGTSFKTGGKWRKIGKNGGMPRKK